jgi:TPP-dependent pyruvate/acetoin dehydrogenase alpha subunit
MSLEAKLYEKMFLIRRFEQRLEGLFEQGLLYGTIHGYVGQEAVAVSIAESLQEKDIVVGNHRSHGHFLSRTDDVYGLLAEIMGRATGIVGGRGGSQHLYAPNFFSNGVIGSMTPVAVGMALARKALKDQSIVVAFIGDGTLGQGVLYESMNMASLWKVPIIYVLENNLYAMSTPISKAVAGDMQKRPEAFGIKSARTTCDDLSKMLSESKSIVDYVRTSSAPFFWVVDTYRFCGHSKSDKCGYRTREEEQVWHAKDIASQLKNQLPQEQVKEIEARVEARIEEAVKRAVSDPWPLAQDLSTGALDPVELL